MTDQAVADQTSADRKAALMAKAKAAAAKRKAEQAKEGDKPAAQRKPVDHPSGDNRFKLVDRTLKRFQYQQDALIEVLHTAQEAFGFLDDGLMIYVARQLKLPLSWVYGVATFYHFFSLKPQGEHSCIVCMGTACYVKQAGEILAQLQREYGIEAGQTTSDNKLSLGTARCLGSCGLAPVLVMDGSTQGRQTPQSALEALSARLQNASQPNPLIPNVDKPQL